MINFIQNTQNYDIMFDLSVPDWKPISPSLIQYQTTYKPLIQIESEIWIKIQQFSYKKMNWKMLSSKCWWSSLVILKFLSMILSPQQPQSRCNHRNNFATNPDQIVKTCDRFAADLQVIMTEIRLTHEFKVGLAIYLRPYPGFSWVSRWVGPLTGWIWAWTVPCHQSEAWLGLFEMEHTVAKQAEALSHYWMAQVPFHVMQGVIGQQFITIFSHSQVTQEWVPSHSGVGHK